MKRLHPGAGTARGFTLMEILIATATFAIVLTAINGVFYGALRLRNQTTDAVRRSLPLQQALSIMQRDLANLVMPGGTLSGTLQSVASATNAKTTLMQAAMQSPDFYTATGALSETSPWGEIQRVAYLLLPPTNHTAGLDLCRAVTRNLLPLTTDEPSVDVLLNGVRAMYFLFFDGYEWRETWDSSTESTPLPYAIKVQLQLEPDPNRSIDFQSRPIELVVPMMLDSVTNQTAQTSGGSA